jgi:hypothetical protein
MQRFCKGACDLRFVSPNSAFQSPNGGMRSQRTNALFIPPAVKIELKTDFLAWMVAIAGVLITAATGFETYVNNRNAREDRLAAEQRDAKERMAIRSADVQSRILSAKVDAVTRLQQSYSNFQLAYVAFVKEYIDALMTLASTLVALEHGEVSNMDLDKQNEVFARSGDKVSAGGMALQDAFIICSLVFDFEKPNVEFLKTVVGNSLAEQSLKKHLPLIKDIYRKSAKAAHSGKFSASASQQAFTDTLTAHQTIRDEMLTQALEIETIYSAFFTKCWTSILETKEEKATAVSQ